MGMKPRPKKPRLVVCETEAALVWHLRELLPGEKPGYGSYTGIKTLCGRRAMRDSKIPVEHATCIVCIRDKKERRNAHQRT